MPPRGTAPQRLLLVGLLGYFPVRVLMMMMMMMMKTAMLMVAKTAAKTEIMVTMMVTTTAIMMFTSPSSLTTHHVAPLEPIHVYVLGAAGITWCWHACWHHGG